LLTEKSDSAAYTRIFSSPDLLLETKRYLFPIVSIYNLFSAKPTGKDNMKQKREEYTIESIPIMRRFALDAGILARKRHIVHGLIEVDITKARSRIKEYKSKTGETLSFTAFLIFCLSEAIQQNPHLHAYRNWRGQLVIFENININTMIEIDRNGKKIPIPHVFKSTNKKTYLDLHKEIRETQENPKQTIESKFMEGFLFLPGFIRRMFYWIVMKVPHIFRKYSSSVMVTAVGMFGEGGGWGITMANGTLTVTIGGIAKKPGVVEDKIEVREYLDLTISIDHDIVDGAPMVRFVNYFRKLIESGYGLEEVSSI
jgi:pyruvate/2-oxoglutarate dehydrogenase complex dihydrolipoamide acyltransferase (E2) component